MSATGKAIEENNAGLAGNPCAEKKKEKKKRTKNQYCT